MNRYMERFILWIVFGGMACWLASCNNDSVSQEQAESFLKYYAVNSVHNSGTRVIESSDGGYAIMSNIDAVAADKDIVLIFTDEFGRQKSEPTVIGTSIDDRGYCMLGMDNGYLICGVSSNASRREGYLVNVSSDGTVIWEQNYSGYHELEFRDVMLASDGNLVLTGYRIVNAGDVAEVIMFKVSATGDMIWRRGWDWAGYNHIGEGIIEFQDRYHIISTASDEDSPNLTHIRMMNTNTDGKGESSKKINTPYRRGKDIVVSPAGEMYILCNQRDPADRKSKIFLAELELTNENQVTEFKDSVILQDPQSIVGATFVSVGDELAIGGWEEVNQNDNDILFLKVDTNFPNLTITARKTYGSQGYQASQHIIYSISNQGFVGYALTGSIDLAGARTTMLLKLDSAGELR